jgi:peptide/nickel transport system substrate-binding protein
MRTSHRLRIVTTALLASAGMLAACSATGTQGAGPASATPMDGGKITYGVAGGGLTTLDPHKVSSAALLPVMSLLYSGLTQYGPDNTLQPALSASWSSSADLKTWTFKLRQGVKFDNGKAFTAQDAVANIQRVLDPKTGSQQRAPLSDVQSVQAVDPATVQFTLSKPDAVLPATLTQVYLGDMDTIAQVNTLANGTGPYKLKQFVPDDHVTLVRNPDYWGAKGKLDEIDVVETPDTTSAVNSLRNHDLDVVWNVPPPNITQLKPDPTLSVLNPSGYSGAVVWELDTTSPPFNDVRARQALSYAVNRAQMLTTGYNGLGSVEDANNILNPKQPEYAKDLPHYDFDLNKAKDLFQQAGVGAGTNLVFWTTAGRNPQWVTMGEILQQDLKKIGINLVIQQQEVSAWLQKFFPAGKKYPGVIVANYISTPYEPSRQLNFFKQGVCECNWADPTYTQLLAQAVGTADAAERTKLYQQMQGIVNQQVPSIIPFTTSQFTVVNKRVVGAWVQSNGVVHLEAAGVTQ